jgi:N6-L-threonylcarbamoyladenine synthase
MKVLAIETSCDETAVAVIEANGENIAVLSNIISSQVELHAQYGGVVPQLASREHARNIKHVFESAVEQAGVKDFAKEIDSIVVTYGPGLGPALLIGITFAKAIAWKYDKPLVPVNHMDGHIHSNWLEPSEPLEEVFPALNVVVSGGHTELVLMRDHEDYEMLGETCDDAVGEAFDKAARLLGLGYPGGPAISKLAQKGDATKYALPRPMLQSPNYDFSYSGLKTAVLYLIRDLGYKDKEIPEQVKADIAASFQEAAIDVIIQKAKRAARDHGAKALLLSGGVSANTLLRERLKALAQELGIHSSCPKMIYTTDNAAMIAVAGYFKYLKNKDATWDWKTTSMNPNLALPQC